MPRPHLVAAAKLDGVPGWSVPAHFSQRPEQLEEFVRRISDGVERRERGLFAFEEQVDTNALWSDSQREVRFMDRILTAG